MIKNILGVLFLILLLGVVFVPSFGALDKAGTQWLYLSVLSLIFLFFIPHHFNFFFKSPFINLYTFFVLLVCLSLFYTNNIYVSVVDFSRHITVFLLVFISFRLFQNHKLSFYSISLIIFFFLIYESLVSLKPLFHFVFNEGFDFSQISYIEIDHFKGVTGNRNITTASIVLKIPFIFYLFFKSKKLFLKLIYLVCLAFPLLVLFIINSRAALLSFLLIFILTLVFTIFNALKRNFSYIFSFIPILLLSLSTYALSIYILPNATKDAATRISSITLSNESSSNRFILWENALDYIFKHPFLGCGIGNWKIESSAYWGSIGDSYLVPFHAHNDFLEFSTELGLLGGITYLLIFISAILFLLKKLFKFSSSDSLIPFIIFLSFGALFIDSFFNFPFERPIMQVLFVILISYTAHLYCQPIPSTDDI
jgi:O-antigen ligase